MQSTKQSFFERDFSDRDLLGGGEYGKVYRAKLNDAVGMVAIKRFFHNVDKENIEDEVKILGALPKSEYWPSLLEYGRNYIAMKLLEGVCLVREIPNLGDLQQRLIFARDIIKIVCLLHQYRLVHLDLRSVNFLINTERQPKLCDFGSAEFLIDKDELKREAIIGCYLPPELNEEGFLSFKADIFNVSFLLLHLLTCEPIFETVYPCLHHYLFDRFIRPNFNSVIHRHTGMLLLIRRMWRMHRDQRPDANEVLRYLNRFINTKEQSNDPFWVNREFQIEESNQAMLLNAITDKDYELLDAMFYSPEWDPTLLKVTHSEDGKKHSPVINILGLDQYDLSRHFIGIWKSADEFEQCDDTYSGPLDYLLRNYEFKLINLIFEHAHFTKKALDQLFAKSSNIDLMWDCAMTEVYHHFTQQIKFIVRLLSHAYFTVKQYHQLIAKQKPKEDITGTILANSLFFRVYQDLKLKNIAVAEEDTLATLKSKLGY